jgi:transcriptional regulator with XRE-family HTH domain
MLEPDDIRKKLKDRRLSLVAEATGLHANTVANVRDGKIENPTYYVLRKLSDYLEGMK